MNDPVAQNFVDKQIRPLCELAEAMKARINVMRTEWDGGTGALFPATSEPYEDGRPTEGLKQMTCFEVIQAVEQLFITGTGGANPWNDQIINKPTVRAFQAS